MLSALLGVTAGCDDAEPTNPAEPAVAAAPEPEPATPPDLGAPEPEHPDEVACIELVDHLEVLVAQSLGVPAKDLFTSGERRDAVEHCKRYAHPNVVTCARDTQVLQYLQTCLFFTSIPRPEVEHPTREQCEAYTEHVREVTSMLQTRTTGMPPAPLSARQQEQDMVTCLEDFTPPQVQCGIEASSQLSLFACFSPYHSERMGWVTAEECEVYGDHMMSLLSAYLMAPFPKPAAAAMALQSSGLAPYAVPQLQRFQLVNLCHTLDHDLMQCHTRAKTAADLATCIP